MTRVLWGVLASVIVLALAAGDAQADKKKKGKRKGKEEAPQSEVIAQSMADLKWGMTKDEVLAAFTKKIQDKYRPLVAKTKDAIEEDRLRTELRAEAKSLRDSFVEFEGRKTGWDVSFLKGEFAHNNGESMLVMRDENSQNFYFFANDRLWKWYKAFDATVFPAGDFEQFAGAVQRKFGDARDVQGELRPGEAERHWLEWQDKTTRLRAIDQTGFYGFFCLVFEDKGTAADIVRDRGPVEPDRKEHSVIEAVTAGNDDGEPDESPNIVDRITGKIRNVEQAPADDEGGGRSGGRSSKSKSSKSASSSSSGVSSDDDPLKGL